MRLCILLRTDYRVYVVYVLAQRNHVGLEHDQALVEGSAVHHYVLGYVSVGTHIGDDALQEILLLAIIYMRKVTKYLPNKGTLTENIGRKGAMLPFLPALVADKSWGNAIFALAYI